MLEPAAALVREVHDEDVALVGEPAHQRREGLHDGARVAREPPLVQVAAPPDRDLVRPPQRHELHHPVLADLERRVGELVVVPRGERRGAALERRRHAPARRCHHLERVRLALAPGDVREHGGAVHVPVRSVEVGGPDAQLVRVDAVADERSPGRSRPDPHPVLVEPLDGQRRALPVHRREPFDVARVLPHEVAAGGPDRKHELDVPARRVDRHLHVEEVGVRLLHREPVVHRAQM